LSIARLLLGTFGTFAASARPCLRLLWARSGRGDRREPGDLVPAYRAGGDYL